MAGPERTSRQVHSGPSLRFWHPANRTVLFTVGPLEVGQEGMLFAADLSLRLLAILASSLFLMLTTRPSAL
ncbi:MAG: hypothetical protein HYZ91_03035, partial [Candidatus Omnitrophica bacterium]|nr:hypothetical protein [Candidatus Omnitrophota bacterium]